jgi:hypothetical protein
MYAKLQFGTSVLPAEMARDIARVLHASDGSGGATTGACEFITAAGSSISDTVASSWSLISPTSLVSGTATNADKYIMRSSHAQSGKYKYVEVGYNGATSEYNDIVDGGFRTMPVLDYGESTQRLLGGYSGTSTSNLDYDSLHGTIHIVANAKCLLIWGLSRYTVNSASVYNMKFLMETAVTVSSAYKTHAPYMFLNIFSYTNGHTSSYQNTTDMNGPSSSASTCWARGGPGFFGIDMYDPVSSTRCRAMQFQMPTSNPAWGGSISDKGGWYRVRVSKDNGTTAGQYSEASSGWENMVGCMVGDIFAVHNYGLEPTDRRAIDSSGNPALGLEPLSIRDPLMLYEYFDMTTSPVYMTNSGQGVYGDTLAISSVDYFYIPMSYRGAYMVKLI